MSEEAVKLEARLTALEYLVQRLYAVTYVAGNISDDQIAKSDADLLEYFRLRSFPSNDPAISGLVSGETEDALSHLLSETAKMTKSVRSRKRAS